MAYVIGGFLLFVVFCVMFTGAALGSSIEKEGRKWK